MITCYKCGAEISLRPGNIGRSETCPSCRQDVRVCKNCKHFDINSYNECKESMAERVVDKERANFCDYFYLAGGHEQNIKTSNSKEEILKKLDDLFKKRGTNERT